jgi:inorganic pyrophosphatase
MRKDPLIDEIRAVRHRIPERFGHDTKALCDHYRELEKKYRDRMVRDRADAPVAKSES